MDIQNDWRLPTGNEFASLPELSGASGAGSNLVLMSKKFRGVVELAGEGSDLFVEPAIEVGGKKLELTGEKSLKITRQEDWIPAFAVAVPKGYELSLRYLAVPGERGFVLDYSVKNISGKKLGFFLGAKGCWKRVSGGTSGREELALSRRGSVVEHLGKSCLAMEAGAAGAEFSVALACARGFDQVDVAAGGPAKGASKPGKTVALEAASDKTLRYLAGSKVEVESGATLRLGLAVGLGLDTFSACAAASELARHPIDKLDGRLQRFLASRRRRTVNPALDPILNGNLFFNYFYAIGQPLDAQEPACLASRWPLYRQANACRDRDIFFWSFPSVLLVDSRRARQMLDTAFNRGELDLGCRSRFLDASVLEPGFQLDSLCAPVIALAAYTRHSGDLSLANDFQVRKVIKALEKTLQGRKHPQFHLYETDLSPAGDPEPMGYATYGNVMVWRALLDLSDLKMRCGRDQEARQFKEQAEKVRAAIWHNLTAEGPRGRMFVLSADLKGQKRFGTEPAGCLQLLPYWGFCEQADLVYKNTQAYLHSPEFQFSFSGAAYAEIGSPVNPQPWMLALCNSLLSGRRQEALDLLTRLKLEAGLASEVFDSKSGKPCGGEGFAPAAGFLAWSLWKAFGKN